jgi:GlpG protein
LPLPWQEPWRFVTPLFLHFNYAQIVFDALLFRELGRVVEGHRGARFFALFVASSAIVSGVAQYELAHSPLFGSMCGVIYALSGWLIVRRRFDVNSTLGVTPGTFPVLLVWLGLGLFDVFHIAKWCQLVGLAFGMAWSFAEFRVKYAKKPL